MGSNVNIREAMNENQVINTPTKVHPAPATRISINTSPARKRFLVPSPASPAKSLTGAIIGFNRSPSPVNSSEYAEMNPSSSSNDLPNATKPCASEHDSDKDFISLYTFRPSPHDFKLQSYSRLSNSKFHLPDEPESYPGSFADQVGQPEVLREEAELENQQEPILSSKTTKKSDTHLALTDADGNAEEGNKLRSETYDDFKSHPYMCDAQGKHDRNSLISASSRLPSVGAIHIHNGIDYSGIDPPSQHLPMASLENGNNDRGLSLYSMMLQANHQALQTVLQSGFNGIPFQKTTGDPGTSGTACISSDQEPIPARPHRSVSNHGSFITNHTNCFNHESQDTREFTQMSHSLPARLPRAINSQELRIPQVPPLPVADKRINLSPIALSAQTRMDQTKPRNEHTPTPLSESTNPMKVAALPSQKFSSVLNATRTTVFDEEQPSSVAQLPIEIFQPHGMRVLLFVRRRNAPQGGRTAWLKIPLESRVSQSTTSSAAGKNEQHFLSLEYDDAMLLKDMRRKYYHYLLGHNAFGRILRRTASLRVLKNIELTKVTSKEYGCLKSNPLSNEKCENALVDLFNAPSLAKERYGLVQWARKNAIHECPAATSQNQEAYKHVTESNELDTAISTDLEVISSPDVTSQCYGVEFVEGWSTLRVSLVFSFVLVATVALCVSWIFLGPVDEERLTSTPHESLRSDPRVAKILPACAMGALLLVSGLAGLGLWSALSLWAMSPGKTSLVNTA